MLLATVENTSALKASHVPSQSCVAGPPLFASGDPPYERRTARGGACVTNAVQSCAQGATVAYKAQINLSICETIDAVTLTIPKRRNGTRGTQACEQDKTYTNVYY